METITVRVRLEDERGRVLLVSEREGKIIKTVDGDFRKPRGTGLPGGRVREKEKPYIAALRELQEETGLVADVDSEPVLEDWRKNSKVLVFRARNPRGQITITDSNIINAFWMPPNRVHGSFRHNDVDYPVYESHMNWINDIFG